MLEKGKDWNSRVLKYTFIWRDSTDIRTKIFSPWNIRAAAILFISLLFHSSYSICNALYLYVLNALLWCLPSPLAVFYVEINVKGVQYSTVIWSQMKSCAKQKGINFADGKDTWVVLAWLLCGIHSVTSSAGILWTLQGSDAPSISWSFILNFFWVGLPLLLSLCNICTMQIYLSSVTRQD